CHQAGPHRPGCGASRRLGNPSRSPHDQTTRPDSPVHTGVHRSVTRELTNVNGTLFFAANDGTHGFELWKSDGTAAVPALEMPEVDQTVPLDGRHELQEAAVQGLGGRGVDGVAGGGVDEAAHGGLRGRTVPRRGDGRVTTALAPCESRTRRTRVGAAEGPGHRDSGPPPGQASAWSVASGPDGMRPGGPRVSRPSI